RFPEVDCEGQVSIDAVVARSHEATEAYRALDVDGFERALERVAVGLPCVDQLLTPEAAATIHRLEGIRLFTRGSRTGSVRSFQEARILDPAFVPDPELIPADSGLERNWRLAGEAASPPWFPMPEAEGLTTWVDGLRTGNRPATLPAILQVTGPSGAVVWTQYVPATAALPSLEGLRRAQQDPLELDLSPAMRVYRDHQLEERGRASLRVFAYTGYGLLGVAAGALITNVVFHAAYDDLSTSPEKLPRLERSIDLSARVGNATFVGGAVLVLGTETVPIARRMLRRKNKRQKQGDSP
ncbi:MAG: hypothetical protein KC656_21465, partial [Myxococcales bacterium]|nr:hypothetical protein [Myxococcales bacterium]